MQEEQLPTEEILEIKENVNLLLEQQAQQQEQEQVTVIDQFIIDNADTILTFLDVGIWWGFVGVPLVLIVVLCITVYDSFIYTKL